VRSTHEAMGLAGVGADAVAGISHDCTTCTVAAVDRADRVLRIAKSEHPCRKYNGGSPVSAARGNEEG
jgi:ribulose kinase